jgi:hypothetical protein
MTPSTRGFRTRAARCAKLASSVRSPQLKQSLETMSRKWEELAAAIEKYDPPAKSKSSRKASNDRVPFFA